MLPLAGALVVYALVSLRVPRPYPTPLDFRAATSPFFALLQVSLAVLIAAQAPLPEADLAAAGRGYLAGLLFVLGPQLVGIARRECIHQFEVKELYRPAEVAAREAVACFLAFPAIAACEEILLRGTVRAPEPAIAAVQFLLGLAASRARVFDLAVACALLAALHWRTGSLALVIGAHAAVLTMTGRPGTPGLFSAVYPLLLQARWKCLSPAWQTGAAQVAVAAAVAWGVR
jgi:hypothetical protein